jgi:Encapsulating protein for peroxidase
MNNLYRELAPITEDAWGEIETEATRTFKRTSPVAANCRSPEWLLRGCVGATSLTVAP